MDIRYGVNQRDYKRYTTQALRDEFLIGTLFAPDDVTAAYSHVDRIVVMGAMPVNGALKADKNIDSWRNFGVATFLERRELGIINIGGAGSVSIDGAGYRLPGLSALYVGKGAGEVILQSEDSADPAKFYMCATPAHKVFPTTLIPYEKALHREAGSPETANKRVLHQFIHPDVLPTCQLLMGVTVLEPGSVWNTMPVHTHERRMEVYFYFNIAPGHVVFHYMGTPDETRHIVMQNEQAVISPSWSIHSGCGTSNYSFIWAMAGENLAFDDMDGIQAADLR